MLIINNIRFILGNYLDPRCSPKKLRLLNILKEPKGVRIRNRPR